MSGHEDFLEHSISVVILSRNEVEAKNPYDDMDKGIVPGILRRSAPQNDIVRFKERI
jgi:hypothetical protein